MHFIFRRVFDDNGLIINKVTLSNDAPQPPYFHMTIPDMSHEIDHRNIEVHLLLTLTMWSATSKVEKRG